MVKRQEGLKKMHKLQRNERIVALTKILSDNPNRVFTFNYFAEEFNCAKSTLSEDINILKNIINNLELGYVETISGAAGGVKYVPVPSQVETNNIVTDICNRLSDENRILSGGFLYMADIVYNPYLVDGIGKIFAAQFLGKDIDYVVTVETKGISIATMTARYLNVPLVIARRNSKVTEGTSVNINYVSASSHRIQTMSLSKRAMRNGSKVLFVDDFLKGGGTVRGIVELMKEFESVVTGVAVLMSTKDTKQKLANDYFSLIVLNSVDESNNVIDLKPGIKLI